MDRMVRITGAAVGPIIAVALALGLLAPAPVAEDYTEQELQEIYSSLLREEGYTPSIDEDGDVKFKFEGGLYFILVNETDPEYLSIHYPGFWEIEDEAERQRAIVASHEATRRTKCAKVMVGETSAYASVEMFLEDPRDVRAVLGRSMSAIQTAVNVFVDEMRE